jgi:hypothetical protein
MPNSPFKIAWQYALVFLLLYTAFVTPLRVTFLDDDTPQWLAVDYTINAMFFIDIIVTFLSAYYDETNELVVSKWKIAKNYMCPWLPLDILSIFPFEFIITQSSNSSIDSYFKLTRIPRIYRLVRMARMIQMVKKIQHNRYLDKLEEYF